MRTHISGLCTEMNSRGVFSDPQWTTWPTFMSLCWARGGIIKVLSWVLSVRKRVFRICRRHCVLNVGSVTECHICAPKKKARRFASSWAGGHGRERVHAWVFSACRVSHLPRDTFCRHLAAVKWLFHRWSRFLWKWKVLHLMCWWKVECTSCRQSPCWWQLCQEGRAVPPAEEGARFISIACKGSSAAVRKSHVICQSV